MKNIANLTVRGINSLKAIHKLLISLMAGILFFLGLFFGGFKLMSSVIIGWNTFCINLIGLSWLTFFSSDSKELCAQAKRQDESRYTIFLIVLTSVCISLIAIVFTLTGRGETNVQKGLHTFFSMLGVALSWILLHTVFTLRYTHLYYSHNLTEEHHHGGVEFPGKCSDPDYFDFAYFSFVIGMTFQVSDVQVTSAVIRRLVLLHGLISFAFNTVIVALTINTLANIAN